MMKVKIYSDGSARSNPEGPGGYGTVIHYVDPRGQLHVREFSAGYKKTTNNRMELMGVITGLEALTRSCEVEVISDSKYVTDAFNEGWVDNWIMNNWRNSQKKTVLNRDLWIRLLKAMEPHKVTYTWVKGHAGHPENERCDLLATTAADGGDLLDDVVDETAGMMLY